MARYTVAITSALALAALLACKKSSPSSESVPTPGPVPAPAQGSPPSAVTAQSFTGNWSTAWGPVSLTQNGDSISGNYSGKFTGVLNGTAKDGVADITWKQTNGEHGKARFTLASDGNSFKGTWGSGASFTNGGKWNGTRKL